jgi:hypothetical protein
MPELELAMGWRLAVFTGDEASYSSHAVPPISQATVNEGFLKQSKEIERKEQSDVANTVGKRGFIGEVAELMSQRPGGSFKGDFGRAAAGAAGASLDTLVEFEISKHVDGQLAKDVFAPNIVESTAMGIAASRLPDKRIALAVAAASWVYGRTENYFESKYHIEEKIGSAWKKYVW